MPEQLANGLTALRDQNGHVLYLETVPPAPRPAADQARAFASFAVRDIASVALDDIDPLTPEPILTREGLCQRFRDPLGNIHTLIEPREEITAPRIRSFGIKIPISSVPAAKRLYAGTLGFVAQTERHYPPLLPMIHRDGAPAFTIEDKEIWEPDPRVRAPLYPAETGAVLIFRSWTLRGHREALTRRAPDLRLTPIGEFPLGWRMGFIDSAGLASEIWEIRQP
ncbi:MAG TPA: hypothetical protein VGG48_09005 [Rhizomicrobium sp.]